jgi:protein phosphatase
MMLSAYGVTDTGRVRQSNEDALFWDVGLGLFVVADGMGGHNAGEVASQLCVDVVREFLNKSDTDSDATMPYGINPQLSHVGNRVATALKLANATVFATSQANPPYAGMGTTAAVAVIREDMLTFASVGDSRVYSWRDGVLTQLTQDDSWVERMKAENPGISQEALDATPLRHVLTNVIGANPETSVRVLERRLVDGELLLLCSDGLYGPLEPHALAAMMAEPEDLEQKAQHLLQAALDAGSRDIATVLLIRYGD